MGKDKIRYLVFLGGRWRWQPTKPMRDSGFRMVSLSTGVLIDGVSQPTAEDKRQALRLNEDWDRHRAGLPAIGVEAKAYLKGSIGEAYHRAMQLREAERMAAGVVWTKEQRGRDDWPRAWKWIDPIFGDCDPRSVRPEQLIGDPGRPDIIGLRPLVALKVSESEAHRVIKVWRALWVKMAALGYCERDNDPSFLFANSAPQPRQDVWHEGEAVRLVKCAWRRGYHGLAALLAVAWDSQLSPVDARSLTAQQTRRDPVGVWFDLARAKTGRRALATLSPRAERVLVGYLTGLAAEPVGTAPIFRNRSGAPYSKDTLGDDFRDVRGVVFGPTERRQLADFRRSGSVEALSGDASPEKLSAKMANSLSASNRLHRTYAPIQLAAVRQVDAARRRGRTMLRDQGRDVEQTGTKSLMAPVQESDAPIQKTPKALK